MNGSDQPISGGRSPLKIRVFSDQPIEFKPMWIITIIFLVILIIFVAFKMAEKCPDVKCSTCPEVKECPACELDCTSCPATTKYLNITTTRYVCQDKRVVENADDCFKKLTYDFIPVTTNEANAAGIVYANATPACQRYNSVQVKFKLKSAPGNITYQIKEEVGGEWKKALGTNGVYEDTKFFPICDASDSKCMNYGEFAFTKDRVYLLRVMFNQSKVYSQIDYSNEHVIDTREGSEYLQKTC